jgi:alkylation response protein AidB-like acyl-CoA dehydrogenase
MEAATSPKKEVKGGSFIIEETDTQSIFIPELFDAEQKMIRETLHDFVERRVFPKVHDIEKQMDGVVSGLLEQLGELGMLGADMPEGYGGMELDTITNSLITETLGPSGSFSVAYSAHVGIGMLPILYYGTDEQKEKYLPGLISGQLKASYCLTEPGSGSDALSARTTAVLSEDGNHYLLNGQKMWITNSGFADVFIVFAKIDGEEFTCFIVEKGSKGLSLGAEEDKMGIKGSSTRQVFFENVAVPLTNVLGEKGKGHHIAFNVLNIGRLKLGLGTMGGAKSCITTSIKYANERVQFGKPISDFGAIQHKLAQQAIQTFALESALYRTAGMIEDRKKMAEQEGNDFGAAKLIAAEEFAIECAMLKVAGSEVLDFVVDEMVQIHGGMGYSEEGVAARAYRDARINRIFEGTNEINRLLTVDMLLKRAMKGHIDIIGPAWAVQKELAAMPSMEPIEGDFGFEQKAIRDFKKIILMVAGGAAKKQMDGALDLRNEQEIIMLVADMMIETFLAESFLLRAMKMKEENLDHMNAEVNQMLKVYIHQTNQNIQNYASDAIAAFTEGDLQKTFLMGLKRYSKYPVVNVVACRRAIAKRLIDANQYCY